PTGRPFVRLPPKRAIGLQAFNRAERAMGGRGLRLERAAYPLHGAGIDAEPFGNDAHTGSSRRRQGLTDSSFECRGNWGAPEALTLTPGPRKPGADSFRDHRTLELGKHAHHLEHRLAGGRRGVEPLLAHEKGDLEGVQPGQETNHTLAAPAQ